MGIARSGSGTAPALTYTCPGVRATVLTQRPVRLAAVPLPGLSTWFAGGTDHLLLTESLPLTADNTFGDLSTGVTYVFDGA